MRSLLITTTVAILTAAFPIAALANLTGTPTLAPGTSLSFDTGATTASGADVIWSGTALTPQGGAGLIEAGTALAASFPSLTSAFLPSTGYTANQISLGQMVVNNVFFYKTNGGNRGAAIVTAVNGQTITLNFITFGTLGQAGPVITQVLNNYGLVPAGFSNYGIAPGSLFIVKGSGLADPNAQALPLQSSSGAGLPTTLNNTSVKVSVNGTITTPAFYYAIASQLAMVLPSNTPVGTGTLTVTTSGISSAAFTIQVVANAMGFDAYYGTGSGLGVAVNTADGSLYNYNNSIPPGTTVLMFGSGLGADAARDTQYVPAAFSINSLAHIYVGGADATIVYQGASGFPGLNQVNVTIPVNAPKGCNVSVVGVNAAGTPTNYITLPIGNGPCSDPAFGTSGSVFQTLSGQTTVKSGFVGISHSISPAPTGGGTQTTDIAFATFQSYTGAAFGSASSSVSPGGCTVNQSLAATGATGTALDAGTSISVNGPGGNATLTGIPQIPGYYYAQLASGFISPSGGTYSFAGTGGKDVGAFNASVVYPSPALTWTNQGSLGAITRASGMQITWNGGAPGSFVVVTGSSTALVNGQTATGTFQCIAPASQIVLNVPGYVTGALPAGSGGLTVENYTNYQTFTAPGIDIGISAAYISYAINTKYN